MTFIGHVWLWSMASFSPSDTCTEPDISIIKDAINQHKLGDTLFFFQKIDVNLQCYPWWFMGAMNI